MALDDLLNRDDLPEDVRAAIRAEVSERARAEGALRRREAILGAVSFAAERFLRGGSVSEDFQEVLGRLGEAVEVGRVYVFENHAGDDGRLLTSQHHEWVAPGVVSHLADPELQNAPLQGGAMDRWSSIMERGEIVSGNVREFPPREREALGRQGIKSIVAVPIWLGQSWWGFAGFDECQQERDWFPEELDALRTAGNILGAAIRHQRGEEALRESEGRFRAIVTNSTPIVFMFDPDGKILLSEGKMLSAVGLGPGEAVGQSVFEMYRDYPDVVKALRTALAGEVFEGVIGLSDLSFEVFFSPNRDAHGGIVGVIGMALDITDRRRGEQERRSLEAQLQRAQKLESLGTLAGGVAHDFNNLLVGMLGHSDLALSKLSPENPARPHLEGVMQAAERASDLSRQMLAYSGYGHFIVKPTDLSALVRENVHLLRAGIPKGVHLRTDLCDTPALIEADVGQMQQVIMNLVINGAEAIGDRSGYVTISTGFETLAGDQKRYSRFTAMELDAGRYVFLEVHDDGPGIDEETLSKVFDPFFTTKFVGRGLGLSALLGIVRGHKGGIDVQTEPGRGTTFRLVFPVTEEAPEDTKVVAAEASLEGTILVIDDEDVVRTMAGEMLTPERMTVLTAGGGAAGLVLYKQRRADIGLVLLDYSMPEMGGEETFKELRKLNPDVPILLSSGFGQEEATRRFKGLGLTGFIQKPYRLATLLAEIRRCLGQR